MFCTDVWYYY